MKMLRKLIKKLRRDRWETRRTIWPYKEGYGVYNPYTNTIVETGITKEQATAICEEMNQQND